MAVVTISRQFGSRGDEIALRVREILGYRFFDRGLIAQVASEAGLAPGEIVDFSEDDYQVRSLVERLLLLDNPRVIGQIGAWQETDSGAEIEAVQELDEVTAIGLEQNAIQAAYQHGQVVIVGRGGQAVLQEKPDVLHVNIIAPLDFRIKQIQEQSDLNFKAAQDLITERDRTFAEYLQRFYERDWLDPILYHLIINTDKWGVDRAAQLIAEALNRLPAGG